MLDHAASTLPRFDRFGPDVLGWNRYEALAAYREQEPPLAVDDQGTIWLFRYEDIFRVLTDTHGFRAVGTDFAEAIGQDSGPFWDFQRYQMLTLDPPEHTRIRKAAGFFSRHLVKNLEPMVRRSCDELIDAFPEGEIVEFSYEFAFKLPVGVIMRMLNLPAADEGFIREWSPKMLPADGSPEAIAATVEANRRLRDYIEGVVEERRSHPMADDIVSDLVSTHDRGELSSDELWVLIASFIVAGHETTTSALALGMNMLLENPDQLELLRNDPSLLKNAAEEILRYEAPIVALVRIPTETVELHGVELEEGKMVQLSTSAANRDPRQFPDPDRFDVTRSNARQHVSFSAGIHRCVGAPLSQLEIPIAFGVLLERLEVIERAGEPELGHSIFRGLSSLPLRVTRRS